MKGKFGRILGNFTSINGEKCAAVLVREGHAVYYTGGSKEATQARHLENRKRLISENVVQLPEGMSVTKPALVQKPIVEEVVEPVVTPKKTPVKKTTAKKKTKSKKK